MHRLLWAALLLIASGIAQSQQYPSRPIRFIVPFPPDGYTLLVSGIGSQAIVHHMHPKRSFDMQRDFVPVARIADGTIAFVVPQSSRANSVQDFVQLAKKSAGKMTFASSGVGGIIHLTGEMFKQAA